MGDRANIVIHEGNEPEIYLYSHWAGNDLRYDLADALRLGIARWTDAAYLTRIIFCMMIRNESPDSTTWYGISTRMQDNENPLIHVFIPSDYEDPYVEIEGLPRMTFAKYIEFFKN
jgi:hypothetical protein